MSITSISRDQPNNVSIVRIVSTDTLATIASANYIANQTTIINELNKGVWQWFNSDVLLFDSADGNAFFTFIDDTFTSLVLLASSTDGTVSPGLMNQVAYYALSGTVISGTNNLPAQVQVPVGSLNSGLNASSSHFWRGDGTWATISSTAFHAANLVYVANDGSNSGNGSITAPYQTIAHALSTITTASATNQFTIFLMGGTIVETVPMLLKPFVNICGLNDGVIIQLFSDVALDASWGSIAGLAFPGLVLSNFTWNTHNIVLDASAFANNVDSLIIIDNVLNFSNSLVIKSNNTNRIECHIINSLLFGIVNYSNCFLQVNSSVMQNVFCNQGTADPSLTNTTAYFIGNRLSNITVNSQAVGSFVDALFYGNIMGAITGDGALVRFYFDVTSYRPPTLLNGAIIVSLASISDGLLANYAPANYTPVATPPTLPQSVQGHLRGIDNALGAGIIAWTEIVGTSQLAASKNGYIPNDVGLVSITLPSTCLPGDIVAVAGKGAGGFSLIANAGQIINLGSTPTSVAGSLTSTNQWDAVEVVCVTANMTWVARSVIGILTVA